MGRYTTTKKAKHWLTLNDDTRKDLLLLTTLLDVSTTHFIRTSLEVSINLLKEDLFDTEELMNEFLRWKDSLYKPETACDFEKILQQKLINQGRVSFKETLQETKKRGKYNTGRPRKEKNG